MAPGHAVRVRVPASSANLGPGFDSVGVALGLWDEYLVEELDRPGVQVEVNGEGADVIARDESHLVLRAMAYACERIGRPMPAGLRLVADNVVPHSRGLGSSATAIVGGILAAQGLAAMSDATGRPPIRRGALAVDRDVTNTLAAELEGHPDNSSASIFGGVTVSWTDVAGQPGTGSDAGRTCTAVLRLDPRVEAVVFVPTARLDTCVARAVLPATVAHHIAAVNSGRAALLTLALTSRPDLLLPATHDELHQEFRRPAYAETMALVDELRGRGFAACVSGAGPSVLVLVERDRADEVVADPSWERLTPGIPVHGAGVCEA